MKDYQIQTRCAGTAGRTTPKWRWKDPGRAAQEAALVLPDTVSVAVGELAGELEEGLLAFCVGAGLQVVRAMMEHEVQTLVGRKGPTTRLAGRRAAGATTGSSRSGVAG